MSAFGGKAEVFQNMAKSPLIAISGHYLATVYFEFISGLKVIRYTYGLSWSDAGDRR